MHNTASCVAVQCKMCKYIFFKSLEDVNQCLPDAEDEENTDKDDVFRF